MRCSVVFLLVSALAGTLPGGARAQTAPTDSILRSYYDALVTLRDTTTALRATVLSFERDFLSAGDETLTFRAESLHRRCAAVRTFTAGVAPVFAPTRTPDRLRDAATELREAITTFRQGLARDCVGGLVAGGATRPVASLRTSGRYTANRIQGHITAFQRAGLVFARRAGFRLPNRSPR